MKEIQGKKNGDYHADDLGLTREGSDRIIECVRRGYIGSASVLVNCEAAEYAARNLRGVPQDFPLYLHLNLVEGRPVTACPLLTRENGFFRYSFIGLLRLSLLHPKQLYRQVYDEATAQMRRFAELFPDCSVRGLDSHQHTHMIPVIFRAVTDAARESGVPFSRLRFSAEPLCPYLRGVPRGCGPRPVNIIKGILLKFLGLFDRGPLRRAGMETVTVGGILFSGEMSERRVRAVQERFRAVAVRRGVRLCFIFHPGYVSSVEGLPDPDNRGFNAFTLSPGRRAEYEALAALHQEVVSSS